MNDWTFIDCRLITSRFRSASQNRSVASIDRLAITDESNTTGKSNLKRIVSMLTRLIQRTETFAENRIEYEYEYEYEPTAEA